MKNRILFLVFALHFAPITQAQITRGASTGEIYIATDWYTDNTGVVHRALFRSIDNGETLTFQYETLNDPPAGEMKLSQVLGDAAPGALYNYGWNELWVSFDYGENWEYREDHPDNAYYICGAIDGVIYKTSWVKLHKSCNFGQTFDLVTDPLTIPVPEAGLADGEFFGINGDAGVGFVLIHTIDYANTYTEIPIDSTVAFWQISGHYPGISRGAEPGELYLVSWWPDYHYKVFYSSDTGQIWHEEYESGYINIFYWGVGYTAGREPGSFYVIRGRLTPSGDHVWLYIDYSNDYGETFTTYFHDLDSLYTSVAQIEKPVLKLSAFPNPFAEKTTIEFEMPENCNNPLLNIYDIKGTLIRQYNITGKNKQLWNGTDGNGCLVPNGVYLYNISSSNTFSSFNKVLFIH